ncbi:DUF2071 domain-containing protein [Streptomyces sp. NPDC046860]|uniref:YqjF family protein n=1 Tax=Streptomyces sp. NPDC046860 TaxID=3154495 RepID=UPI0033F173F8
MTGGAPVSGRFAGPVEDVTPLSPRPLSRVLFRQWWRDLVFLHWPADPDEVARLLPPGTVPDLHLGRTYVGLVFFRMEHLGLGRGPAIPYLGSFGEVNVRLYSTDVLGRRGVVFRSLDCDRLLPVLTARAVFGLPYRWARIRARRFGSVLCYDSLRRDRSGAGARVRAEVSHEPYAANALEEFLTCRWGLHAGVRGRGYYLPNVHPRWTFTRCELLRYDESAVTAAGLSEPHGEPESVLYAPGVPVHFGPPLRLPEAPRRARAR